MTKKRIILIAAALAVLITGAVIGTNLYRNRFDAGEYVQAVLDVSYKNETEQYVEITGVSKEEAEQIFENNLDNKSREMRFCHLRKYLIDPLKE